MTGLMIDAMSAKQRSKLLIVASGEDQDSTASKVRAAKACVKWGEEEGKMVSVERVVVEWLPRSSIWSAHQLGHLTMPLLLILKLIRGPPVKINHRRITHHTSHITRSIHMTNLLSLISNQGSLEYAYARLQAYSSWLEVRMVGRFDRALGKDDLPSMAECAKVMEEFGRGKAITQVGMAACQ